MEIPPLAPVTKSSPLGVDVKLFMAESGKPAFEPRVNNLNSLPLKRAKPSQVATHK